MGGNRRPDPSIQEIGVGMNDVDEILLALEGKWSIDQRVRTNTKGNRSRDVTYNNAGEYFFHRNDFFWYGTIRDYDLSRPDSLLVGHAHFGPGDSFVAWYKPEDVTDGWD